MATNMFKKYTESLVREWDVPVGTRSGVVVLEIGSNRVGVTITARGDVTISETLADGTIRSGISVGGVGNRPTGATVAVDGSWLLLVATAVNGTTAIPGAGTDKGTAVYRVTADGTYSLVAAGGVFIGRIDDGTIVLGIAPVQIGIA